MTEETIKQICSEYLRAKHQANHESYRAFCEETLSQFRGLLASGWSLSLTGNDPYATSQEMFKDFRKKKLKVFTGGELCFMRLFSHNQYWRINDLFPRRP